MPRRIGLFVICHLSIAWSGAAQSTLVGQAILPGETFAKGPTSGRALRKEQSNGVAVPFVNQQPVQGFSSLVPIDSGRFLALADNGFGRLDNSADFLLRIYTIHPEFRTQQGKGAGTIAVESFLELADPDRKIPFPIVHQWSKERILTGADFDPEALVRTADGTFWIGDEFGPFLLHFSAEGKLLEPPYSVPDAESAGRELRSPENPFFRRNAFVRVLNAARGHARLHGNDRTPVFSPSLLLLGAANIDAIKSSGYPIVVWTVNQKEAMLGAMEMGVNGIISDRPDLLRQAVAEFDANKDGKPGDYLDADGLVDPSKFDAQGHRGSRDLRPESSLPAMEVALDMLMSTLEMDASVTADGIAVLSHDPVLNVQSVRRTDGGEYSKKNAVRVKDLTLAQIQKDYVADKLTESRPEQKNDLALSPVAVAYAKAKGLGNAYTIPTLAQIFDFVPFYTEYYGSGAGKSHPEGAKRSKNARRIRYNIETKTDPLPGPLSKSVPPDQFAKAVADAITAAKQEANADIQSFDFRTLRIVQENYPKIRTVYLFDFSALDPAMALADLTLPPPSRDDRIPARVQSSGGFEGMGIAPDGTTLYPMLEKPLVDATNREVPIFLFDVAKKTFLPESIRYPLDEKAKSCCELSLYAPDKGVVIERDDSQGDLAGFKALFDLTLDKQAAIVEKRLAANLLDIRDPNGISATQPGDVGVGKLFGLPFFTIESVIVFDASHVAIMIDNNFPLSVGRHKGSGKPDDSELVLLKLDKSLGGSEPSITRPIPLPTAESSSK